MTQAVRWVSSSLEEVADDKETDDEDSIPLVPLSEEAMTAMENAQFLKLLTALGLLPPSHEQVQFRARIIPWSKFVVHESYMIKIM
jgi:timeless